MSLPMPPTLWGRVFLTRHYLHALLPFLPMHSSNDRIYCLLFDFQKIEAGRCLSIVPVLNRCDGTCKDPFDFKIRKHILNLFWTVLIWKDVWICFENRVFHSEMIAAFWNFNMCFISGRLVQQYDNSNECRRTCEHCSWGWTAAAGTFWKKG